VKEKFNPDVDLQNFHDVCKKKPEQAKAVFFEVLPELATSLKAVIQLFDPEVIFVYGPVWHLIPESVEALKHIFLKGSKCFHSGPRLPRGLLRVFLSGL